jgi:hypothetical protein
MISKSQGISHEDYTPLKRSDEVDGLRPVLQRK